MGNPGTDRFAALTSAPLLGTGIERNENGELRWVEHLYWFPDYAIRDEIEELLNSGSVVFNRAPGDDADEPTLVIER